MRRSGTSENEVRDTILKSAEQLFAERGYSGTTVRDIATRAGVTGAMIHYYFGSKEKLHRSILQGAVLKVRAVIEEAARDGRNTREKLTQFIEAYSRFIFSHPDLVRMLNREMLSGGGRLKSLGERYGLPRNYELLRAIIARGVNEGELRKVDVDLTPVSLTGMILLFQIGQPLISTALGTGRYNERFIRRLAAHTTDLFLRGAGGVMKRENTAATARKQVRNRRIRVER